MMSSRGAQFAIMISLALAATDTLGAGFAKAEEIVTVGVNGLISDAPFYIGQSKSYFAQQGIALKLVPIDAGTRMIAPLSMKPRLRPVTVMKGMAAFLKACR